MSENTSSKPPTESCLWTQKYRPTSRETFVGNPHVFTKMDAWFKSFQAKKNKKNIILLIGPPGLGKTSAAHIIMKDYGYETTEYQAGLIKDGKQIKDIITRAAQYCNILDFFQGVKKPGGVIMDEIDNMCNGMKDFVNLIKNQDITSPIICTTNSTNFRNYKILKTHAEEIYFNKPSNWDMEKLIKKIIHNEKIKLEQDTFFLITKHSQGDLRRIVMILNDLFINFGHKVIDIDKVQFTLDSFSQKEINFHISEIVGRILYRDSTIDELSYLFYSDCAMVPLLVLQNYPKAVLNKKEKPHEKLRKLCRISQHFVNYDILATKIYQTQDWALSSYVGLYSTTLVNKSMGIKTGAQNPKIFMTESSTLLNKISQYRRNLKAINNTPIMLQTSLGNFDLLILSEYILFQLFHKNGKLENVINILKYYKIPLETEDKKGIPKFSLEHLNAILNLNKLSNKKITSKLSDQLKQIYSSSSNV